MSSARHRSRRGSSRVPNVSQEDYEKIIVEGDASVLVNHAKAIGSGLAGRLTTAQIRNVFSTVRQIEMSWGLRATDAEKREAARQLVLLKPKLVYQAERQRGKGVRQLAEVLTPAIDLVGEDRQRFKHFVDFFEAILAYHTGPDVG